MRSYILASFSVVTAALLAANSPAARAADRTAQRPVHIEMTVPADAQVWFDGFKTTMQGSFRNFESPPVTAGHSYVYKLQVRSAATGLNETKSISVRAGDRVTVDFVPGTAQPRVTYLNTPALSPVSADFGAFYYAPDAPVFWSGGDVMPGYYSLPSNAAPFSASDQNPGGAPGQWNHMVLEG